MLHVVGDVGRRLRRTSISWPSATSTRWRIGCRFDTAIAGLLPDDFRATVVLHDVADLDYSEIAEVLGGADRNRQVEDHTWSITARRPSREPRRYPRATSNT